MTGSFSGCMIAPNYAAVALKLQQTAFEAEAAIFALEPRLRAAVNPPTQIRISTGTLTVPYLSIGDLRAAASSQVYSNTSPTNFFLAPLPAGVWEVGVSLKAQAVGAVTPDSYRYLFLSARSQFAAPGDQSGFLALESTAEADNGNGMDMCMVTTVVCDGTQSIVPQFKHFNSASSVQIAAGALFWVTRLSDATALKVV